VYKTQQPHNHQVNIRRFNPPHKGRLYTSIRTPGCEKSVHAKRNKSFSPGSIYPSDQKKTSGLIFIQLSNHGIISNHFLLGAQPPIYCSFARHLVGKMEIFVAQLLFTKHNPVKENTQNQLLFLNSNLNKAQRAQHFLGEERLNQQGKHSFFLLEPTQLLLMEEIPNNHVGWC